MYIHRLKIWKEQKSTRRAQQQRAEHRTGQMFNASYRMASAGPVCDDQVLRSNVTQTKTRKKSVRSSHLIGRVACIVGVGGGKALS